MGSLEGLSASLELSGQGVLARRCYHLQMMPSLPEALLFSGPESHSFMIKLGNVDLGKIHQYSFVLTVIEEIHRSQVFGQTVVKN